MHLNVNFEIITLTTGHLTRLDRCCNETRLAKISIDSGTSDMSTMDELFTNGDRSPVPRVKDTADLTWRDRSCDETRLAKISIDSGLPPDPLFLAERFGSTMELAVGPMAMVYYHTMRIAFWQHHGEHPLAPFGYMSLRQYGPMALWPYGPMVLWPYGPMVLWSYGPMALWPYG